MNFAMSHTHAGNCNWNGLKCVCVCVQACYCIGVLPIHGNVAQSIGECFWGMPPAWLPQVTGDAELADEIVVQVE